MSVILETKLDLQFEQAINKKTFNFIQLHGYLFVFFIVLINFGIKFIAKYSRIRPIN